MPAARRLVINADDFGFSVGINRGIMEAFAAGTVRSTSLMPTMPAFDDAVRLALAAGPRFGVGLHFTLTVGRPLTSAPSLVDRETGDFMSLYRLARRALRGGVDIREAEAECGAQIERCQKAGIRLTHLDGHHHAHALPVIRHAARRVAARAGIRFVRHPGEPLVNTVYPWRRIADRVLVRLLAGRAPAAATGLRHADHFYGPSLFDFDRFEQGVLALIDRLPAGTSELMVHPGYVDGPLPGGDWYTKPRERELAGLVSPAVRERLNARHVQVVHFGEL